MAIRGVVDTKSGKVSPWRGKYDPQQFIVPGQDHNGHSERMYCRVIPEMDRRADTIVASKKFPFRSKGDLVRWCVKVGLDRLEEMEPAPDALPTRVDAILDALRDEAFNREFLTMFEVLASNVQRAVQDRALGEARRMINVTLLNIEKMTPGYWRDRYIREVESRFGHLLSGPQLAGVKLGESEDGPVDEDD